MTYYFIYLIAGLVTGILSCLFGFGGGFVVVPLLSLLLPWQGVDHLIVLHMAITTSLFIMVINSINAMYLHHGKSNIIYSIFFKTIPFITLGAVLGAILSSSLDGQLLRYLFILFLSYTVIISLFKKEFFERKTIGGFQAPKTKSLAFFSLFTGMISSLLGIGGSVISVPYFRKHKMPMINSSAMASSLSLPIALAGSVTYFFAGMNSAQPLSRLSTGYLYWPAFIGIVIGSICGQRLAIQVSHRIPDHLHSKIYIVLLCLVIISMCLSA